MGGCISIRREVGLSIGKYGECSSVGRTLDCGSRGHEFDPHHSPQPVFRGYPLVGVWYQIARLPCVDREIGIVVNNAPCQVQFTLM